MITLTEALDPTLRRILEEDQQANFIWNLENYMSSYIHFLLCSIFTTLFIILAIWGASKIIKYWHSDHMNFNVGCKLKVNMILELWSQRLTK